MRSSTTAAALGAPCKQQLSAFCILHSAAAAAAAWVEQESTHLTRTADPIAQAEEVAAKGGMQGCTPE